MSQGMNLEKLWLNGNNGRRSVVFEFAGSNVELLRKDYLRGKAQANVLRLKQSLNELKDRMFNLMRTAPKGRPTGQEERRYNHEPQFR